MPAFVSPDDIRTRFSRAMSNMYRSEVPAYGTLVDLVSEINADAMARDQALGQVLRATDSLDRLTEERHGAIRLGTAGELFGMRRLLAVMGMFPVGYYDLSVAGIPVHATAFRPITGTSLKKNPFRIFTSLLRLDLIRDPALRVEAEMALAGREIFTPGACVLIERAERDGGLTEADAVTFVQETLKTFRWHERASVSKELYDRLQTSHRLLADVVSFRGPHINHLTPRTLDIDRLQALMPARGIVPKETIEGPPSRQCPILLRQTSFRALVEPVAFRNGDGSWQVGSHTARFGEVEQRGIALKPKGRALYDELLQAALLCRHAEEADPARSAQILREAFATFPDSYAELRRQALAYFEYAVVPGASCCSENQSIDDLVAAGHVSFHPIVYEDFLPVSAAGIFRSNLGQTDQIVAQQPNQSVFEAALGCAVIDQFSLYEQLERASIECCRNVLQASGI